MPGIGVVFNPKSRRNLRDPGAADRLARRLGEFGVVREARSLDELARIAEEFRRLSIDVLAISGGDGTNAVTITGFLHAYGDRPLPLIALLRGGTMNTVASSVGVQRGCPEALLGSLVARYARGGEAPLSHVERNVLRVAPESDAPAHYGFLFGAGVVHGFLAEYYAGGEPTPLVAARILARGVASAVVGGAMIRRMAKPFYGTVALDDGTRWPRRNYLAVAAGTVAHMGLGFMPFYRFNERPGAFHVLGIHASPAQFVRELPRIHRGRPMREGRAFEALASTMVVQSEDGALRYMVDGDLHEAGPAARVTVSMGPCVHLAIDPRRASS